MTRLDLRSTLSGLGLLAGNEMLVRTIAARRSQHAPRAVKPWYRIENAAAEEAEMWIYDYVDMWGVTADQFARDLRAITAPKITVRINSGGGDVFDGIAIMNALRSHPANVTTRVDGLAASIASVIAQAGDTRVMAPNAQMMVHDASGMMYGNAEEMRAFADLLEKVSDNIAGIYADRSGKDGNDAAGFRALMLDETWLNDTEAVDLGLADEVGLPENAPPPTPPPAEDEDSDEEPDDVTDAERVRIRARWLDIIPNATRAAQEQPA